MIELTDTQRSLIEIVDCVDRFGTGSIRMMMPNRFVETHDGREWICWYRNASPYHAAQGDHIAQSGKIGLPRWYRHSLCNWSSVAVLCNWSSVAIVCGYARQALDTVGVTVSSTIWRRVETHWLAYCPDGFRGHPSETIGSEHGYSEYEDVILVACRWAARHASELIEA